ncbi:hypothetical protein BSLG_002198 [Batrachochytrium salamandrivorans]|nr:hypothetical protein BSLG_002198 [Batrachochytrium salamandrivorans]
MVTVDVSVMLADGGVARDVGQNITVESWTSVRDFIQIAVHKALGPDVLPSQYAMYESELFRPPPDTSSHAMPVPGRRRSQDGVQRRIIRTLDPEELPLVVLAGWQLSPHIAATHSFFIKPIEQGLTMFGTLRAEQCRSLPVDKLRKRLDAIAADETLAVEEVWARHAALKDAILLRIQYLQKQQ